MEVALAKLFSGFFGALLVVSAPATAEPAREGVYEQKFSSYGQGECSQCLVYVKKKTPNIIEITGNNGWVGYAVYSTSSDQYDGFFEWRAGTNSAYLEGIVHKITVSFDKGALNMEGERPGMSFRAFFQRRGK